MVTFHHADGGISATSELDTPTDSIDRPTSEEDNEKVKCTPENAPPLPVNLPASLLENIDKIKKVI